MDIALMIEGQNGLNWPRWQRLAHTAEDLGFAGLYRSDHFTNTQPPDRDSLELWVSLAWLASHTQRIKFGPLVSPVSFRHPVLTARMAAAIDDLSGGRLTLGVGAGWQAQEHHKFGFDLLEPAERFDRFTEGLEVICRLLQSEHPVDYAGKYYHLHEATLLPRPQRPAGPPVLVGGNGPRRTLPLAAELADEWNAVLIPPARFRELNARLDELLQAADRPPGAVRRSLMTNITFGRNEAELAAELQRWDASGETRQSLRAQGVLVGSRAELIDQLGEYAEAGVQSIMLQWLDLDGLDRLAAMAEAILPAFQR